MRSINRFLLTFLLRVLRIDFENSNRTVSIWRCPLPRAAVMWCIYLVRGLASGVHLGDSSVITQVLMRPGSHCNRLLKQRSRVNAPANHRHNVALCSIHHRWDNLRSQVLPEKPYILGIREFVIFIDMWYFLKPRQVASPKYNNPKITEISRVSHCRWTVDGAIVGICSLSSFHVSAGFAFHFMAHDVTISACSQVFVARPACL